MVQPMKNMQRLLAVEEVSLCGKSCEVNKRREPCEIDYDLPIVHSQWQECQSCHELLVAEHKGSIFDCINPVVKRFQISGEAECPKIQQ
jgi:hypothetical protein